MMDVSVYVLSGAHIQQIAGRDDLFCNRHLWVYDSTEIERRNSLKENWDQLFVIFKPPSLA